MRFVWFALFGLTACVAAQQPGAISTQGSAAQPPNAPAAQPTRPEDLCTIEGQAVSSVTGEPLKKAVITLRAMGGHDNANLGATTDASGHFTIENIDPGHYDLSAQRNGYVQFRYSTHDSGSRGGLLMLGPGQKTRDLVFRMIPQGVITGHIADEDGEPVEHAQVNAMRYRFFNGQRQFLPAGSASTDDEGEYRVFGLPPGKYYLRVNYRTRNSPTTAQDRHPAVEANEWYVPTYFPGTNDPSGAAAVEVAPGAVLTSMDVTLHKTRTVRIRGHVANPAGEGLPPFVSIRIAPKDTPFLSLSNATRVTREGTFEIRDLMPGPYLLMAQWSDENKFHEVRQAVDVGSSNLDDLAVLLTPFLSLKGQVRVDGGAEAVPRPSVNGQTSSPGALNLASLNISLMSQGSMGRGVNGRVTDDGTFALEDLNADSFRVTVYGLPRTFYIKSIRLGDVDVLDAGLDLTRGASALLDILVSPNGGEIDGVVTNAEGQLANGSTVALVPDAPRRGRMDLFKVALTDASGHFSLMGISPGDYKMFAWEEIDPGAYQDPEFLQPFESRGESVSIREGSREDRQLGVIPAESTPKNAGN